MKDILDLSVSQIRIFTVDAVPIRALRTQEAIAGIAKAFSFVQAGIDPASGALGFQGGRRKVGAEEIVIETVAIEPRRIHIQVLGTSQGADACFEALRDAISEYTPQRPTMSELVMKSEETSCTVTLEFSIERLFTQQVLAFAKEDLLPNTSLPGLPAIVRSLKLGVEVGYVPKDNRLNEQGITLSNKHFLIEPRVGTRLEERRYFTSSPLGSDAHLRVLDLLESRLRREAR